MKRKTQLGKRLASAAMAVILSGTTAAGGMFSAYGALDPEQTFGKVPVRAVLGGGSTVGGLSYPGSVLLADEQAVPCTAQLFAYLKAVGESPYVLYGHQNDTHHKGGEDYPGSTSSDTKDMTGSISAIVGIDALSFTGSEMPLPEGKKNSVEEAALVSLQAAQEGAIMTLSAHMPNFSLVEEKGQDGDGDWDYSGYTPGNTKGDVMSRILPGGDLNEAYNGYLDLIADYGLILQAQQVPVLFRPLHENNGSWFWWGAAFCDEEGYKNVYRYTVEYLRDVKNVHNFLYVYSPGGPFDSLADFESRYPGDAWVDVIGFDMYHDNPSTTDTWMQSFAETALLIDQAAQIHGKIPVVAETGMRVGTSMNDGKDYGGIAPEGNARPLWFSEIHQVLSGTNIPYYMVWANWDGANNFYSPYKTSADAGHEMTDAFINYYNDPTTVFANGTNFYGQVPVPAMEKHGASGYILSPASGDRILYPTNIRASLENAGGDVSFILKNKEGDVSIAVPAKAATRNNELGNVYEAQITEDHLKTLGKTTGTIDLVAGGTVLNTINAIFNIKEPELDPLVVDDFENYLGDSLLLLRDWATNSGSGCNVDIQLSGENKAENDYGMAFRYTISENGNGEGWAGATKPYESKIASCNAMQVWVKPDGKGQKLVLQLTSNGEDFEVHLPEFAATTEAKYVTIPFAAMKGKNGGVFDPNNVSSFGIWCNTVNPAGSGYWQVDSVIYIDDIHMVNTDSSVVEFLDTRTNSDGSEGSGVKVIRNTMEAPLLWYGPGFAGVKSMTPEPVTVTTLYQGTGLPEAKYETSNVDWLMNGKDTDYVTFTYNCTDPEKAGWSVMGWGATINGEWTEGPRYNAPNPNSLQDTTIMVSVKELKTVLGIERGANVSYLNLGTWNDGNLKSVTLTKGDVMPGRVIVENVPANYTYETNDVGWIVDAPDNKYINLVITCDHPKHSEWEIMGWGASVGEDWVEGPKYIAWKPATHEYAVSYTVKRFKELLGVTPERPLTYIKLGSYNDGRIVRLSLDDEKMPFVPFYSWRERHPNAKKNAGKNDNSYSKPAYNSPNKEVFAALSKMARDAFNGDAADGTDVFDMRNIEDNVIPANYGQLYLGSLAEEIAKALAPGKVVVVKYTTDGESKPNLLPSMEPALPYRTVAPVWTQKSGDESYAIFTLDSLMKAFSRSLIPADVQGIDFAGDQDAITVEGVAVMPADEFVIVDESSRLTEQYGQFPLKLGDYNASYEEGDTVTVTITFDREVRGNISADVNGEWNSGNELSGRVFTRTFTPDAEGIYTSISEFNGASYAEIVDVKVEIAGKVNFDQAVDITTNQATMVIGGSSQEIADAVGLTEEEIKEGTRVEIITEGKEVSSAQEEMIQNAAETMGRSVKTYTANDVTAYKIPVKGSRTQVNYLQEPMMLRFALPEGADPNQSYAVARITGGTAVRAFSAKMAIACALQAFAANTETNVEWLYDIDDNPQTITVESNQLGYFVIVSGDDLEAESLHVFEKAWGGDGDEKATYKETISHFYPEFEPGDTVRVTAVFNKESNVKFMMGSIEKEIVGRRIKFEAASYVDELMIQAGDESKLPLKLLDVEIELVKKAEKGDEIHTFAKTWDAFETSFDEYFKDFVPGEETKVVLTFDKPVKARIGYNKASEGWANAPENWEDESIKADTKLEVTIVPGDNFLNVEITDMNGNDVVRLMDVKVEQEEVVPPPEGSELHTFEKAWGGNGDEKATYTQKLSHFYPDFGLGDTVKITATFDKESNVKFMIGALEKTIVGKTIEFEATSYVDELMIQAGDESKLPLKLMDVKVELVKKAEKGDELHTFAKTWDAFETSFDKYLEGFEAGKETKVVLTFDKAVKAQIGYNKVSGGWATVPEDLNDESIKAGTTLEAAVTPGDTKLNIEITDMNGNAIVKLMSVKVEQVGSEEPEKGLHSYTDTWKDWWKTPFSNYSKGSFEAGKETKVVLEFDQEVKAVIGYNDRLKVGKEENIWTQTEATSIGNIMEAVITPDDEFLNVDIADMNGNSEVWLTSIKVSQEGNTGIEEGLHSYTDTWKDWWKSSFADYSEGNFEPGKETKIVLEFDQEVKAVVGYNDRLKVGKEENIWTQTEATSIGKTMEVVITPDDEFLNVDIADMNGNSKVWLISIKVSQEETTTRSTRKSIKKSSILFNFTEDTATINTTIDKWLDKEIKFTKGQEATITIEFDQEVEAQISAKEDGEWVKGETQTGTSICDTFDLSAKDLKVTVLDMNGYDAVNIVKITVELGDLQEKAEAGEDDSKNMNDSKDKSNAEDKDDSKDEDDSETKETAVEEKASPALETEDKKTSSLESDSKDEEDKKEVRKTTEEKPVAEAPKDFLDEAEEEIKAD